jgi:hypothetical protein
MRVPVSQGPLPRLILGVLCALAVLHMTLKEIWAQFTGTICLCGRKKIEKQSFCRVCYHTLDPQKRYALYNRFGEGYEEAFEVAIAELRAAGRIAPEPA